MHIWGKPNVFRVIPPSTDNPGSSFRNTSPESAELGEKPTTSCKCEASIIDYNKYLGREDSLIAIGAVELEGAFLPNIDVPGFRRSHTHRTTGSTQDSSQMEVQD